jgi:ketosteroid isomerase-like protein
VKVLVPLLLLLIAPAVGPGLQAQDVPRDSLREAPASDSVYLSPAMQDVKTVIDRFGRIWEDEDMQAFADLVAHDDDMVVIGTDDAEYVIGYDSFHDARERQYASYENVEFNIYDQSIKLSESGEVAWFAETFDLFLIAQGEPVSLEGIRLTGVLEKRDGAWKIVQLHTSVPVPGQAAEY